MRKINNLYKGEHGTFFKFVTFCVTVFIVLWIVGPGNTVLHWARSKSDLRHQKKQMELYQKEIEQMRRQVRMLEPTPSPPSLDFVVVVQMLSHV